MTQGTLDLFIVKSVYPASEPFNTIIVPVQARSSVAGFCGKSGQTAVKLKAGSQAARVLAILQKHASTDHQIAQATGLPLTTVLARRWALIKRGLVQQAPVAKVETRAGTWNSVWGVTEQGRLTQ